jgi:hypothetical protein
MQDEIKSLAPIGLYAAAAHGGSVLAMGAGAVSFAQIVKAGVCVCVFVCNTMNTLADIHTLDTHPQLATQTAERVYVGLLCLFIPKPKPKP